MIEKFWFVHAGYCPVFSNVLVRGSGFSRRPMPFLFGIAMHSEHGPVLMDAPFDERGPASMGKATHALFRSTGLKFEPQWSVAGRLDELGFSPEQVKHVLVTHLHGDHTGGMKSLPEATFHASRAEWEHANNVGALASTVSAYAPADYESLGEQFELYDELPGLSQRQGFDVFDDGSVEMFLLPGHTPGHCVYRIHIEGGETILYAADAAHTVKRVMGKVQPGLLPKHVAYSLPEAERSLAAIRAHLDEFGDDVLLLCHDPGLGEQVIADGAMVFERG